MAQKRRFSREQNSRQLDRQRAEGNKPYPETTGSEDWHSPKVAGSMGTRTSVADRETADGATKGFEDASPFRLVGVGG